MKKSIALSLVLVLLCSVLQGCAVLEKLMPSKEFSAEDIYEMVAPSVVEITAWTSSTTNTGTGFFWNNEGTVITNYHVIKGCISARITLANGQEYKVNKVLGYSENKDIAILSTDCKESKSLVIRNNEIHTGEVVYAIGSSLGLTGSLSNGIVSSASRNINGNTYIQTTAPLSHGNSGGPLVDSKGQVIGITSATLSEGQNINFAIPIDEVYNISTENPILMEDLFEVAPENKKVMVRNITIVPANYDSEHSWEQAKITADFILEMWENGEATEASMIEVMDQYGESQGGGELRIIERGVYVDEVNSWCFDPAREVGDVAIIENVYGYTIIYFSGIANN